MSTRWRTTGLIALYLGAIVLANLLVLTLGPSVTILNAFCLIGLDLTVRDHLHETWQGKQLWLRMLALIAVGGLISLGFNVGLWQIALASCLAFITAGIADTLVYQALKKRPTVVRVNASNIVSAAVDSVVFPTLAFGVFLPVIILGQWAAKVGGGALWWMVLSKDEAIYGRADSSF